jgi:ABC-type nitrate/sulfonate/bicarbonate transport system substrate-binding protein
MSVRRIASIVGVVAAAMLGAGAAHSADPVKIRHAWIVPVTNIASMMFAKPELAKHNGKSYVFEAVRFQGSPPMVTALAAGEIEVALLAWSSIGIAIENAGLHDVRVVADEVREGVGDKSFTHQYMVLKDGPIQKVEDLKGKTLATNAMGAAVDIAMRAMLRKHGLEHRRDYNIVETGFPNMKAMLMEKKVDLIPGILPFALDPELRGAAKVLFTEKDAMGPSELAFLTMRRLHRQEPRRHRRLPRRLHPRHAVLDRPQESRRDAEGRGRRQQAAGRDVGELGVPAGGLLPRPQRDARPRRPAIQPGDAARPRLPQDQDRHQEVRRPQHGPGGGEAAPVGPPVDCQTVQLGENFFSRPP